MSRSNCNMFYTPAASGCSPLPILDRMSQAKCYICMLQGGARVATPTKFEMDVASEMQHSYAAGAPRVAAPTNSKKDVSSEMLLAYVADESYSPLLPQFIRMHQAISHICMLRVPRTQSSKKIFIKCPNRKATCSIRPQLPDARRYQFWIEVSSDMLHSYLAGAPKWPHPLILNRMSQARCYLLILRVSPTRRSAPIA